MRKFQGSAAKVCEPRCLVKGYFLLTEKVAELAAVFKLCRFSFALKYSRLSCFDCECYFSITHAFYREDSGRVLILHVMRSQRLLKPGPLNAQAQGTGRS